MHSRNDEAAAVLRALRQLVHGLRVTAYAVERDLGLTGAQLFVLGEIAAEPKSSIRRVAERTLTDPSSASVVIGRLLEQGLIARQQDPKDKRISVLSVTSDGQAMLDRAPEPYQAKLFGALRKLPRQQLHQLYEGLTALVDATQPGGAVPLFFEGAPLPKRKSKKNV